MDSARRRDGELSSGRQSIRSHQQWMSTFGWEKDVWEMEDIDGKGGGDWDWGSWSEEEEKWPDANFAAVHIHKTIRYPIVIVVDYQYSRFLLERLLCQWPEEILMIIESLRPGPISLHTHTDRNCSIIPSCLVSSHRQVKSFLMASSLLMFGRFSLILTPDADVYVQVPPPRHSWEKFRQVPAVGATRILWIKRKFIMWRGDRI